MDTTENRSGDPIVVIEPIDPLVIQHFQGAEAPSTENAMPSDVVVQPADGPNNTPDGDVNADADCGDCDCDCGGCVVM